jgi:hypothetical protein
MNPVRDAYATATARRCGTCDSELTGRSDQQYCKPVCRQRAWRQLRNAPVTPTKVPRFDTVYECSCGARYLGEQRCPECNIWCRRLGPGGSCPNCDEPVALQDIVDVAQLPAKPTTGAKS